jgi:hypothetical protein
MVRFDLRISQVESEILSMFLPLLLTDISINKMLSQLNSHVPYQVGLARWSIFCLISLTVFFEIIFFRGIIYLLLHNQHFRVFTVLSNILDSPVSTSEGSGFRQKSGDRLAFRVYSVPPRKDRDNTINHNFNPNHVCSHFHVTTGVRSGIRSHAFNYATTASYQFTIHPLIWLYIIRETARFVLNGVGIEVLGS